MSPPSRARRPGLVVAAVAAILVSSSVALAQEVPLPGPVLDTPVQRLDPEAPPAPGSEPLWEIGIGVAAVRFPDYRGSDQSSSYTVPLPFVAYRGRFLRADRDGARAILFVGRRVLIDLSLAASVPTRSSDNEARRGMPDLPATFEIGPNFNLELWQSDDRVFKLDLRLPVREAITLERSPRAIGLTFSPNLNLDIRRVGGSWNVGLQAGGLFGNRRYHEHFYSVEPEFATPTRPAYDAPGGYAGWRVTTAASRRLGNAWIGGFLRYDDVRGASFAASPLVRQNNAFTAGIGISWIFAVSNQRVVAED